MFHMASPNFLWLLPVLAAFVFWRTKHKRAGQIRAAQIKDLEVIPKTLSARLSGVLFLLKIAGLV